MCADRKQIVTAFASILAAGLTLGGACAAPPNAAPSGAAGGVAIGESQGGVTDRAYISAPPFWSFVVEREPGSFLDCGEGMDARIADEDGRDLATLLCGVTLTETIVIPAAAESARVIIHF